MAKDFTKRFVGLSREGFASQASAKLRLDHRKGGLDVRPLVVVLIEIVSVQAVVMEHLVPSIALAYWLGVLLEINVRLHSLIISYDHVGPIRIRFVSRDLGNVEVLGRVINQWSKH